MHHLQWAAALAQRISRAPLLLGGRWKSHFFGLRSVLIVECKQDLLRSYIGPSEDSCFLSAPLHLYVSPYSCNLEDICRSLL